MLNSTKAEAEEGVEMALAKPGAGAGAADFKVTTGNLDNGIIDHFSFGEDEEVEIEMPSDVDMRAMSMPQTQLHFPMTPAAAAAVVTNFLVFLDASLLQSF